MAAYYNELDPYASQWLGNLVSAGHIAAGQVDNRSIKDVAASDVRSHVQCHFFAGIGVWSHALRLAGWTDNRPVWTGSCPCQPFSTAGKGAGFADERHLWPVWFELIRECRPPVVFGEQVASPAGLEWLDAVFADLEGAGYAVGAADLCAASVGAPHIRQRLYWVAYASDQRREGERLLLRTEETERITGHLPEASRGCCLGELAHASGERLERSHSRALGDQFSTLERGCSIGGLGNSGRSRGGRDAGTILGAEAQGSCERSPVGRVADELVTASATRGFWADADWIPCTDGKARPVKPGSFPLANGSPSRVGRLRAYGNAIVADVAATFVSAAMDWINGNRLQAA